MFKALAASLLLCWGIAHAGVVAISTDPAATIALYDDPCALTHVIRGLPLKATWQEKGVTHQGCYSLGYENTLVVMYFSDLTIVLVPVQMFKPAQGT